MQLQKECKLLDFFHLQIVESSTLSITSNCSNVFVFMMNTFLFYVVGRDHKFIIAVVLKEIIQNPKLSLNFPKWENSTIREGA